MKRTSTVPGVIRWRKIGGGSFYMHNKIIKPNQIFDAHLEDIPDGFRDVVVPLDDKASQDIKTATAVSQEPAVQLEYFVKSRGGGGYYDVVDKNGKVLNEKALRKAGAESLIESLQE